MSRSSKTTKIYVGNLPTDIKTREIEDLFLKYGRIVEIDLKNRKTPPFAFVEFEDDKSAAKAVTGRDGHAYDGYTLRVEFPRGLSRQMKNSGSRSNIPFKRSEYRVVVSGMPPSGSWQDLKDHMREAGEVGYADVYRGGTGVVEFLHYDDMKYAIKKLDDSKFRSHEGETSYIRVHEERPTAKSRDQTISRSYSRSRSRS